MKDRGFIINSIKMDLLRVVTAAGNINQVLPIQSIQEFLNHAKNDFEKLQLSKRGLNLKKKLWELSNTISSCQNDSHQRLRWAEKILTIRCRL